MRTDPFTLLVLDPGAQLLDPDGRLLAELGPPGTPGPALDRLLPARAPVQLVFAGPKLTLLCQEVPPLSRRERRAVQGRLLRTLESPEPLNSALVLDPDPRAEGGRVLWLAAHPRRELELWLDALEAVGARVLSALPWPRAVLSALPPDRPGALVLVLLAGSGHLLAFRGRALATQRGFPLPKDSGPAADDRAFQALLGSELARVLAFLRQKHRDLELDTLFTVGLAPGPALTSLARAQGLRVATLGPELPAFLAAGAARERPGGGGLDLLPEPRRASPRHRLTRALVWTATLGLLVLGPGTRYVLGRLEASLEREALRAEAVRDQRRILAREGEEAARLRFGLLRLRRAEQRQGLAMARLERLGLTLFQLPPGVQLERVEILQLPGEPLRHRFTVTGAARTRRGFALGPLTTYLERLAAHPGLSLDPLGPVTVQDRQPGDAPGFPPEPALARFRLSGSAP